MVFRSPFPDVTVPDTTVHAYVLEHAAERGEHPALVDGPTGRTITYAELDHMVRRLAAGLAEAGVRKGDVLALYSPNSVLYPVVFYAAGLAGATVTTVNALYTAGELAGQLRDAKARWLVTVSALLPAATQAAASAAADGVPVDEVFVCDAAEGHRSLADLMATDAPEPVVSFDPSEDLVVLPYSSGTTGLSKGVMLTHRNVVANIAQVSSAVRIGPGDRLIGVLPFFHIYGLTVIMNHALSRGATVVVMPRFDLEQFLSTLESYRINRAYVVPPIVLALAKHPAVDAHDLSALERVFSAAAPLDADLGRACADRLGVKVTQGYGMTELSPASHLVAEDEDPGPGTVGRVVASTECRLVDVATGEDVGPGDIGEIWVRGPQVMKGYLGREAETAVMVDEDGWLRTGDLGRVDDDGLWYVVDRVKELIKYKGYQVPPAELEALLLTHPQIADAAVVGVLDEEGNEVPKAFVVRAPGVEPAALDARHVTAFVAERIAPHKKVRQVEFIDAVPRSMSGKILRRQLRPRTPSIAEPTA